VPWPAERTGGSYYYTKIAAYTHKWGECTACNIATDFYVDDVCFSNVMGICINPPADYPTDLELDIAADGRTDYAINGRLASSLYYSGFSNTLNEIAESCNCSDCSKTDLYCTIPNTIYSSSRGILNYPVCGYTTTPSTTTNSASSLQRQRMQAPSEATQHR